MFHRTLINVAWDHPAFNSDTAQPWDQRQQADGLLQVRAASHNSSDAASVVIPAYSGVGWLN